MSAYEVGTVHIDALLTAGLAWAKYGPLRWQWRDPSEHPDYALSHQAGEPWGPTAHKVLDECYHELTRDNAGSVGAMLMAENRRSVDFRYDESEIEAPYLFSTLPGVADPVVVLKALACYEYQSCETPDWSRSEAHAFCDALRHAAIRNLGGYDDAPGWEVHSSRVFIEVREQREQKVRDEIAKREVRAEVGMLDRAGVIAEIRSALKRRSGKTWSVTGGRGTAWGWLRISAPPKRCGEYGRMSEADTAELATLLDVPANMAYNGVSIPSGSDSYAEYIDRANGRTPRVFGKRDWD